MRPLLLLLLLPSVCVAQSTYLPLNEDYYHRIDRYEIKSGKIIPDLFTSMKPYKRSDIISFVSVVKEQNLFTSQADLFNEEYFKVDSWEWSKTIAGERDPSDSERPIMKHFYTKKADFYSVKTKDFDLHVNPVLYVGAGKDSRRNQMLFTNTRGFEIRGMVDNRLGFYTYVADNQALLPSYVGDQMTLSGAVPHEGFWKGYKGGQAVDFLHARGYITFDETKHINIQFGHDRFFVGNGYRSLTFSDYAPPALFLKGNVKVWKLNYLFLLNQMTADNKAIAGSGFKGYPNKYVALHHLSLNIGQKLNIGVFESVTFSPADSASSGHFRVEYLNPIIFYRAIEQQNGSSDNASVGLDFKWIAAKNLSVYGQFMLDELVVQNIRAGNGWWANLFAHHPLPVQNIRAGNGWWANKFAVQAGAKYIDAFTLANLDLQGEVNIIRPYTYSHHSNFGSYTSFRQPLAHPLGANLREYVGIIRYQPLSKLNLTAKLIFTDIGRDAPDTNWGSDILKSNQTREQEFNNTISQGVSNKILFGSFTASWQLKHNFFIDALMILRNSESPAAFYNNNTTVTSLALRWNIAQRLYEF